MVKLGLLGWEEHFKLLGVDPQRLNNLEADVTGYALMGPRNQKVDGILRYSLSNTNACPFAQFISSSLLCIH